MTDFSASQIFQQKVYTALFMHMLLQVNLALFCYAVNNVHSIKYYLFI